jgi:hypothetical protein
MWGETSYLAMSGRDLANALEIMVGQFELLSSVRYLVWCAVVGWGGYVVSTPDDPKDPLGEITPQRCEFKF